MASLGTPPGLIRFGPFALDPANRELRKRGYLVRLQPQQFAVLLLLVERAGQIVSREEIHQHIWGNDTFVDFERGINFSINQIRAALGDDADKPRFIETIPRRGYRFIHPVELLESCGSQDGKVSASEPSSSAEAPKSATEPAIAPELDTAVVESAMQNRRSAETIRRKWLWPGIGLAALLILSAVFLNRHGALPLQTPLVTRAGSASGHPHTTMVTSFRGNVQEPTFSPDGKQIAYFWNGKDQSGFAKFDIYVQMIGGERPLRLTWSGVGPTDDPHICCLAWSPDGQWISFARCRAGSGTIFKVPVLGGPEHKVTDAACWEHVRTWWTLDGKSMLLNDRCVPNGPRGIVVFSFATGEKRCLIAPSSNNAMVYSPKISPDGRMVAFLQFTTVGVSEIYVIPLEGGGARRLTADGKWITDLMWAADGKRIIFSSDRGGRLSERLWEVPMEGGDIKPETIYPNVGSLSPDGRRIAFVWKGRSDPPSIWRADLSGPGGRIIAQKKIISSLVNDEDPQLSPDGTKIVFISLRSGDMELWKSDADGSNPLQITSFKGEWPGYPRWSPDGKWIVFHKPSGAYSQVYVIDSDGRNLHAITAGDYDNRSPSWSRDGQSIYFVSMRSGVSQIWNQRLGSKSPVQITKHDALCGFESYDGQTLYFAKYPEEGLWSVPVGGGMETRVLAAPRIHNDSVWAISQTGVYLSDYSARPWPLIEFYNFESRKLTPVIPLEHSGLAWYPGVSASRDGRTVLFVQWDPQSSIAMVEDFQ